MKVLWRVERQSFEECFVMAESAAEAEDDAINLGEFDFCDYEYYTEGVDSSGGSSVWSGGPDGEWT